MVMAKKGKDSITKLYLETSVWNFLHAPDSPEKMVITKKLFQDHFTNSVISLHISPFVLEEISKSRTERRNLLETFITSYNPKILTANQAFQTLSEKYIQADILPERYHNDLFHIAMASVHKMHAILSWNLKHIVRRQTIEVTNSINIENGIDPIKIFTPEDVITYVSRTESNERDPQDP